MTLQGKVVISLTDEQILKLEDLFYEVEEASLEDKPIMLLAQLSVTYDGAIAICGTISHEKSLEIQSVFNKRGQISDYKYWELAASMAEGPNHE